MLGQLLSRLGKAAVTKMIYGANVAFLGYEVGTAVHKEEKVKIETVTEKVIDRENSIGGHTYVLIAVAVLIFILILAKTLFSVCGKINANRAVSNAQASIELGKIDANLKPSAE